MKKTLITLLALAGVAVASEPTPVWTSGSVDMTQVQTFDLSSYMLSTAAGKNGFTLMVEFNGVNCSDSQSSFWVDTAQSADVKYSDSAATFVWSYNPKLANTSGSSNSNVVDLNGDGTPSSKDDYITDGTYAGGKYNNVTTTYFITSYEGTAYLYQKGETEGVVCMFGNSGMIADDVTHLQISNWAKSGVSQSAGTATFTMFDGVLSTEQMGALAYPVPEPATATLSLLALAGLAARRRRK